MNKRNIIISSLDDLDREERKAMQRIKSQEIELSKRVKQMPEEIVTLGVVKVVSGIVEGGALKSLIGIVKRIGKNVFSSIIKDEI